MRVLVTGATGFVGSKLVGRLVASGDEVVAVSRNPERAAAALGLDEAVGWDELDAAMASGIDAVVHLAGETVQGLWMGSKSQRVSESRLDCTRALLAAIQSASEPPQTLLSASGIGFYGDGGESILDECAAHGEDFFAELCVDWESIAQQAEGAGCRVVLLRFGIILGPSGGALKAMLLPTKMGVAGRLGSGQQWWSWVALADAVSAIAFIMKSPEVRGAVNVVAPEPIRQVDFQRALGRAVSRPSFMPAPAFAVRAILGMFAAEVLSSKRVVPSVLNRAGFSWEFSQLDEALSVSV